MSQPIKIDIDADVFEFLQAHAIPFVDTPNDVLRRLLLPGGETDAEKEGRMLQHRLSSSHSGADKFVNELLQTEFGGGFRRRAPYRLMFESAESVVYIQNFNKASDHLWYRVTEQPWGDLTSETKSAWICFTNPAERFAYVIPVKDVEKQVQSAAWNRPYLEVNIDPSNSRWTELDWNLEQYRRHA